MKKGFILLGVVVFSMFLLAGCGGGGGGSSSAGHVTSYFHVQDNNGNSIAGLSVVYTDPSGTVINSPSTDSSGNATIITYKVGTYTVNSAVYNNVTYPVSGVTFYDTQSDLDSNAVVHYTVIVNMGTGVITITQS